MNLYLITLLIVLQHLNTMATSHGMPISPCPKIFQYRYDGVNWFGLISVRNPNFIPVIHLRVILSMSGQPETKYIGEIELLTWGKPLHNVPTLYKVKFPKSIFPPKLLQISIDNKMICFGAVEYSLYTTQIQLEHIREFAFIPMRGIASSMIPPTSTAAPSQILPSTTFYDFGSKSKILWQIDQNKMHTFEDICGINDDRMSKFNSTADVYEKLLVNYLSFITRGAFPWLAAIYTNNVTSLVYHCTGTLVSSRNIISSAHCFKTFMQSYTPDEVVVLLGRHNLENKNEEGGSLRAAVSEIYTHPDFDKHLNSYDADIAIIVLKNEVGFNAFIRSACIWSETNQEEGNITSNDGIVVAWQVGLQYNETEASALLNSSFKSFLQPNSLTTPKIIYTPIVSNDACFKSNSKFRSLSSNRTFCAGVVNNSSRNVVENPTAKQQQQQLRALSLCSGDSGAGLMIYKNNRWILRGIVAATLAVDNNNNDKCFANQYVIYTDISKFLDWILALII